MADLILSQPNFTAAVSHNPQVGEESLGTVNAATQGAFSGAHVAIDPASGRLFVAEIEVEVAFVPGPMSRRFTTGSRRT